MLSSKSGEQALVDIILKETTTLGIRRSASKRYCMDREVVKVDTGFGEVRVKIASKGEFKKAAPEFEDCREIALKTGMPVRDVYELVMGKVSDKS